MLTCWDPGNFKTIRKSLSSYPTYSLQITLIKYCYWTPLLSILVLEWGYFNSLGKGTFSFSLHELSAQRSRPTDYSAPTQPLKNTYLLAQIPKKHLAIGVKLQIAFPTGCTLKKFPLTYPTQSLRLALQQPGSTNPSKAKIWPSPPLSALSHSMRIMVLSTRAKTGREIPYPFGHN